MVDSGVQKVDGLPPQGSSKDNQRHDELALELSRGSDAEPIPAASYIRRPAIISSVEGRRTRARIKGRD